MKNVLRLAAAFALAPLALTTVAAPTPAYADGEYWDPKIVVGSDPYALIGTDLDGKKLDYANYKGKVLLVDFWATWCGPCVAEIPNVLATYKKYHGEGFEVLGISLDRDKTKLTDFIKAKEMPWAQSYEADLPKGEGNAKNYGVQGIPFVLLIGKDGKVAAVNPRGEALEPALKAALAK